MQSGKRKRPYVLIQVCNDPSLSLGKVIFCETDPTFTKDSYCVGPFRTNGAAEMFQKGPRGKFKNVAEAEKAFAKASLK